MKNEHNKTHKPTINVGVNLLQLRSSSLYRARDLKKAAATLTKAHDQIQLANETIKALSEIAEIWEIKQIDQVIDFIDQHKKNEAKQLEPKQPERKGFAVDEATRQEIRYRYSIGVPMRRLAQDFKISRTTVSRYIKAKSYLGGNN